MNWRPPGLKGVLEGIRRAICAAPMAGIRQSGAALPFARPIHKEIFDDEGSLAARQRATAAQARHLPVSGLLGGRFDANGRVVGSAVRTLRRQRLRGCHVTSMPPRRSNSTKLGSDRRSFYKSVIEFYSTLTGDPALRLTLFGTIETEPLPGLDVRT